MGGSSKSQVIGYRYLMGIHMGICRGPIDALVQVNVGGKRAWPVTIKGGGDVRCAYVEVKNAQGTTLQYQCTLTPISNTAEPLPMTETGGTTIVNPNLFGGDAGEGGIEGGMYLLMGEPTQGVIPLMNGLFKKIRTGFRGVVTIYFNGLIASLNPYPKVWDFRLRRTLKGWMDNNVFYPAKAKIILTGTHPEEGVLRNAIHAMNPAHIIYECLTNAEWGVGLPSSLIDTASFTAAADTLYSEEFGLSFIWARQELVTTFIGSVVDHIGAAIYVSRETGLTTIKLIRADYNVNDLQTFDMSTGLITVDSDDDVAPGNLISEVIVTYTDGVTGETGMTRVQNLASMRAAGSINSKTTNYVGCPTAKLANRLAQRDLRVHGTSLRRLQITMNRRGWKITPASVIRIVDPTRRLTGQVFRVGKIVDSEEGSKITLTLVQDVFGLSVSSYVTEVPPPEPDDKSPLPAINQRSVEASYLDLYRYLPQESLTLLDPQSSYQIVMGQRPSRFALSFNLYAGTTSGGYADKGIGQWSATGTTAGPLTKRSTQVFLATYEDDDRIKAGTLALIEDEYVRINSYDTATKLANISRGCVDTVPADHAAGVRVWFPYTGLGDDTTAYAESQTISSKLLTNSWKGQLHPQDAPVSAVTFVNRHYKPYPPAYVRLDQTLYTEAGPQVPGFTVSWSGRNRLTQQDVILAFHESGVTAEVGTTYQIRVYRASDNAFLRSVSAIATLSWQYTDALWSADGAPSEVRIELESVRGSEVSYQYHSFTVKLIPKAGFGNNWGNNFGGGIAPSYPVSGVSFLLRGDGPTGQFPEFFGHPYLANGAVEVRTDLSPFGAGWVYMPTNTDLRYSVQVISNQSEYEFTSGNKTAEARILLSADSQECTILELPGQDDSRGWRLWVNVLGFLVFGRRYALPGETIVSSGVVLRGVPQHVAVTRVGNMTRLFIEGVLQGSGNLGVQSQGTGTIASSVLTVGGPTGVGSMRIEEVRINTTTATYTANFTPPSGPFPDPV